MEHWSHWAAADEAGLRGGVTTDQIRDNLRKQLEQLFEKEQSVTKTVANMGEGPSKGLTASSSTRDAMRFSSNEKRRLREMPSPRESCYSARSECRFFSDRPAKRSRSLTPDHDIKSRYGPIVVGRSVAAGMASNSPRRWDSPGGLDDISGRRARKLHENGKRDSLNIIGSFVPDPARHQPSTRAGCFEDTDSWRLSNSLSSSSGVVMGSPRSERNCQSPRTTSQRTRESLRFFLDQQEGPPERMGRGLPSQARRRQGSLLSSRRPEVGSCSTPVATPRSFSQGVHTPLRSDEGATRQGGLYLPGRHDSCTYHRLGTRTPSAGKRDFLGRDSFEASLRC